MGFFAVVRASSNDDFRVIGCHLNLWSLPGLLRSRLFLWDVGLRLRAGGKEVSVIQLAVPFGTDESEMEDICDRLTDQNIARLVFGTPPRISDGNIEYTSSRDGDIKLNLARVLKSSRDKDLSGSDYTLWKLELSSPIKTDPHSYVRVRFPISNLGRLWDWKRSTFSKNGAIVNIRISDVRESIIVPQWKALEDRIVPIESLNLLVIAPAKLRCQSVSPAYHYMRLLEGQAWQQYTNRVAGKWKSERLIVYQWRSDAPVGANPPLVIDPTNPFRVFLDLTRESGLLPLNNHLLTAILVLLPTFVVYYQLPLLSAALTFAVNLIEQNSGKITIGSLFMLVFSGLWRFVKGLEHVKVARDKLRSWFRRADKKFYRA